VVVEGNRGLYDRFRGRVIFPIADVSGRIIAFGGRLVDGEGAKYLNSPEGVLFRKRECLYLLHRAKQFMRARGRAILVEGYMDALRLHMEGFGEAVASLGTALTSEQADLVKRFAPRCYICFAADAAGQEAAVRGMYVLQSRGLDVRVVSLPEAKDPDEFLSAPGVPPVCRLPRRGCLSCDILFSCEETPCLSDQREQATEISSAVCAALFPRSSPL
jgi:DNA primase